MVTLSGDAAVREALRQIDQLAGAPSSWVTIATFAPDPETGAARSAGAAGFEEYLKAAEADVVSLG